MPTILEAACMINNAYHAHNDVNGRPYVDTDAKTLPMGNGWVIEQFIDNTGEGGDAAAVFKNTITNEIFIAGRGTATLSDAGADLNAAIGGVPDSRVQDARAILKTYRDPVVSGLIDPRRPESQWG